MKTAAFTKTYGERTVLDMPETELPEGRITAVIGPNGSGKSTYARIIAGLDRADGKKEVIRGVSVGYLPQKSFAFRMSTKRNVLLNGKDRARAAELMKTMGIDALARQSAKKLSGGESAKMALCRILMGSYDLLILDEPTASMDTESTLAAEELIRSYCDDTGCTVLLITHSIRQAMRIADRAILLDAGKLIERGEAARLLSEPSDDRTAGFLKFYGP